MGPSPWYVELSEEDGKLYIFKNGSRMKAEGNYKDGDRPFISYVLNARRHLSDDGKLYIVVSLHLRCRMYCIPSYRSYSSQLSTASQLRLHA